MLHNLAGVKKSIEGHGNTTEEDIDTSRNEPDPFDISKVDETSSPPKTKNKVIIMAKSNASIQTSGQALKDRVKPKNVMTRLRATKWQGKSSASLSLLDTRSSDDPERLSEATAIESDGRNNFAEQNGNENPTDNTASGVANDSVTSGGVTSSQGEEGVLDTVESPTDEENRADSPIVTLVDVSVQTAWEEDVTPVIEAKANQEAKKGDESVLDRAGQWMGTYLKEQYGFAAIKKRVKTSLAGSKDALLKNAWSRKSKNSCILISFIIIAVCSL